MAEILNGSDMQTDVNSEEVTSQNVELTLEEKVDLLFTDVSEIKEILEANNLYTEEETHATVDQKWTEEELAFASQNHDPFSSEALGNAGSYGLPFTLFGFSIVFCVLAVIMVIISVFGKIFGISQPKQKTEQVKKTEPKKQNSMVEEVPVVPVVTAPAADDKGIVAAIIAAISSFRSANGEIGGFRVVSFKKRK